MNDDELNTLTEKVIGCAFNVSNISGSGFLEKVYENALAIEVLYAPDLFTAKGLNYLKATGLPICLLLNFGKPRVEVKQFRF
ncbi:MAG: GxxExxY protein [Planctomycetota bacterium]